MILTCISLVVFIKKKLSYEVIGTYVFDRIDTFSLLH